MHIQYMLICGVLALGIDLPAHADAWQGNLKSGGTVRVDPQTRKPTLYYDASSTQLWNGVHKMEDGSVIIVRDGVVVPNEPMYRTWSRQLATETKDQIDACEKLVRKACGFHNECSNRHACELARQLQRLQEEESSATDGSVSDTVRECHSGLFNLNIFPPCEQASDTSARFCVQLVTQTCGPQNQCQTTPACDAARQLQKLEQEERLGKKDPNTDTEVSKQCQDALGNPFFVVCQ